MCTSDWSTPSQIFLLDGRSYYKGEKKKFAHWCTYYVHDVYNLAHTGEIFLREGGATELQGTHPISLHKSFLEMPLLSWFLLKEFEFANA